MSRWSIFVSWFYRNRFPVPEVQDAPLGGMVIPRLKSQPLTTPVTALRDDEYRWTIRISVTICDKITPFSVLIFLFFSSNFPKSFLGEQWKTSYTSSSSSCWTTTPRPKSTRPWPPHGKAWWKSEMLQEKHPKFGANTVDRFFCFFQQLRLKVRRWLWTCFKICIKVGGHKRIMSIHVLCLQVGFYHWYCIHWFTSFHQDW